MSISTALLPEFDEEMKITRRFLERVPEGKGDWAPHAKSMSLKRLSAHVAEIPSWLSMTLNTDSLDMAPKDGSTYTPPNPANTAELVAFFDKNVAEAREVLEKADDALMNANWSLLAGGQTILTMPKHSVIRTWVLSHNTHHRAQLGVYLRMNDIPVPATYGPSADDQGS